MNDSDDAERLADLATQMGADLSQLLRAEMELARGEFQTVVLRAKRRLMALLGGIVLAHAGLLVTLLGLAQAPVDRVDAWIVALATGMVVGGIGGALLLWAAKDRSPGLPPPARTLSALARDGAWLKAYLARLFPTAPIGE